MFTAWCNVKLQYGSIYIYILFVTLMFMSAKPCLMLHSLARLVCGNCFTVRLFVCFLYFSFLSVLWNILHYHLSQLLSDCWCDLYHHNQFTQLPQQRGAKVTVTLGMGTRHHDHQVNVPCPWGEVLHESFKMYALDPV